MKFPKFNVHDQPLIETAWRTGQPEHIHRAIRAGIDGMKSRLAKLPHGFPILDGRPHLMIKKPCCFFDEYVVALTLQEVADSTGQVVTIYRMGDTPPADHSMIPEVVFENE